MMNTIRGVPTATRRLKTTKGDGYEKEMSTKRVAQTATKRLKTSKGVTSLFVTPNPVNPTMPLYYHSSPDDVHLVEFTDNNSIVGGFNRGNVAYQSSQQSPFSFSSDDDDEQETQSNEIGAQVADSDEAWVIPLIEGVQQHPCLWQSGGTDNKNQILRDRSWQEIAEFVKAESGIEKMVEVLKKRWTTRRDAYFKGKKHLPTGSSAASTKSKSTRKPGKYDAALSFLDSVPRHRPNVHENFPRTGVSTQRSPNAPASSSTPIQQPPAQAEIDQSVVNAPQFERSSKKKPANAMNEAVNCRIIETLEKMATPPPPTTKASRYPDYGSLVNRALNTMKDKKKRKEAAMEIIDWLKRYENYDSDDSA